MPLDSTTGPPGETERRTTIVEPIEVAWIGDPGTTRTVLARTAPHVQIKAYDASTAADAVAANTAGTDVVVIDTTLSGADTSNLLARIADPSSPLPVLVLTGSVAEALALEAAHPVCDGLVKTAGFEQQLPLALVQARTRHDLVVLFRESRDAQERLRTVLEFQPAVMSAVAADGTVSAINQAGLSLLGADRAHVVGTSLAAFVPADQKELLLDLARRASAGTPATLDHVILTNGAPIDVRTTAVPAQPSGGATALLTITERSADPALAAARTELERMQAQLRRQHEETAGMLADANGKLQDAGRALAQAHADREAAESSLTVSQMEWESRLDALLAERAEAAAALTAERARIDDLLSELTRSRPVVDAWSRLQHSLQADHAAMTRLRDELVQMMAEADTRCSAIIERQEATLAELDAESRTA